MLNKKISCCQSICGIKSTLWRLLPHRKGGMEQGDIRYVKLLYFNWLLLLPVILFHTFTIYNSYSSVFSLFHVNDSKIQNVDYLAADPLLICDRNPHINMFNWAMFIWWETKSTTWACRSSNVVLYIRLIGLSG